VRGHVSQHVRRRLNRPLISLVHADFVPTDEGAPFICRVLTPRLYALRASSDVVVACSSSTSGSPKTPRSAALPKDESSLQPTVRHA
jgi:hypothetical protein